MSSDYEFDTHEIAGSGIQIKLTSGEAISSRDLVYVGADGYVYVADASAAATMPVIGMAMFTVSSGGVVSILLKGVMGLSTWTWTAGNELYASDTAGEMSASTGTVEQQVGIALSATQVYIDPKVAV